MQVSIMKVWGVWSISNNLGNGYISAKISAQSFNIAFLEAPKVTISAYNSGGVSVMTASAPTTTATGEVYLMRPASQTGATSYIEYIAIGRWK